MKKGIFGYSLLVFISTVLVLQGVACSSDSNTSPPSEESIALSMIKIVPSHLRSFVFADVKAMRNDPDIVSYLDLNEGPSGYLDSYGMDSNDVNQSAVASYVQGLWMIPPLQIVKGDYNLEGIKDLLGSKRYTKHDFAGEEIWDVQIDEYTDAVAFLDEIILIGYGEEVRNAIETMNRNKPSLYDDEDFRGVVSRLPIGISMSFREREFLGQQSFEGLLVAGLSTGKKDENTMNLTWILKFEDEENSADALDDVRNHVEGIELPRLTNVEVKQSAQFIRVNAQTSIENYFGGGENPSTDEDK